MIPEFMKRRTELERICRQYRVRRLALFGSATTNRFVPSSSDLDFLVEFEEMPNREFADAFFGLQESLENLFGLPVDLVTERSVKNPYFLESIAHSRALLYAS